MVPFTRPSVATRASSAWLSTSTSALPMPTTSSSARSATAVALLRRKVAVEQEAQALSERGRKRAGVGDHRVLERIGAAVRARAGQDRDDPPQHFLGGGHVLHE